MNDAQRSLPFFRSHKIIQAARLNQVIRTNDSIVFVPADESYSPIVRSIGSEVEKRCMHPQMFPNDPGVFCVYPDGFESWSPTAQFNDGYTEIRNEVGQSFSAALAGLKAGSAWQRAGWNGKGLMVKAQFPDAHSKMTVPYLYIKYPDGLKCPWLASQTDIMAHDWHMVAEAE